MMTLSFKVFGVVTTTMICIAFILPQEVSASPYSGGFSGSIDNNDDDYQHSFRISGESEEDRHYSGSRSSSVSSSSFDIEDYRSLRSSGDTKEEEDVSHSGGGGGADDHDYHGEHDHDHDEEEDDHGHGHGHGRDNDHDDDDESLSTSSFVCGCNECTSDILEADAGEFTCAERIEYLMEAYQLDELDACVRIARMEFPFVCGPKCDPGRCDGRTLPEEEMPSTFCGCKDCTQDIWNRRVDGHTCGARISYMTDFNGLSVSDSCNIVGGHEFPNDDDECGLCDPKRCEPSHGGPPPVVVESHCGRCSRCDDSVWNLDANGTTCGERIEFLKQVDPENYPSEIDACRQVASVDYPHICGSSCDPKRCDSPLSARTPIYCFPEFDQRTRLRNMWGNHTVEVKESRVENSGLCSPNKNKFTSNTVSKLNHKQLKLQFKKVGDDWVGSEVRIRLPNEDMPFHYGTYSFSIKSIEVRNTKTDLVESYMLPPSLVLSLHTYDSIENSAINENFNHQVGIEISRFDKAGPDARFAVQPAIDFNTFNFYTGPSDSYVQAPSVHSFDWSPNTIDFRSSSLGEELGESFTYSTQDALDAEQPDYIQCLPADVEIRISLWNLHGTLAPTNIESHHHVVEVVIDDFTYKPSGLEHIPDGAPCSKDCQCQPASRCYDNVCTDEVLTHYEILSSFSLESANDPSPTEEATRSWQTILALTIFSCSVSALSLLAYQATKMRCQNKEETFPFNLAPGATTNI